jgi:hypothetical protein
VDRLLADARGILEAARAAEGGETDLTILVDTEGAIRIVQTDGTPLRSLQLNSGAHAAFRVSRRSGAVRVEGRCGAASCLLKQERADKTMQHLSIPFDVCGSTAASPCVSAAETALAASRVTIQYSRVSESW